MSKKASFMEMAFEQAQLAGMRGEVPVGAVLVKNGKVIAANGNRTLELNDPTAHAEILVIRKACMLANSERLPDHDLYVTLEPCPMCAAGISFARIRRLYFGANDPKSGGVENGIKFYTNSSCHHVPDVYSGIMEQDCGMLLRDFFKQKR